VSAARRFALLTFVGMVFAQAAWILALPPYRAIDEFDHVYRAAAVADGQWRATQPAQDGRGLLVEVPDDIVEAASAQCASLPYFGPDNCAPVEELAGGRVTVAAATGSYHPAFYWVVGTVAQPFEGAAADYAMRIFSALLCALAIAYSAHALVLAGAGPWTKLAFLVSLPPVLIYTTVIPAPNSWEIVAGLCVWTTLLAVGALEPGDRRRVGLLLAAVAAGCVLVTPRALGPLWLALIVLVVALFLGWRRVKDVVVNSRGPVVVGSIAVVTATAAAAWWSVSAGWIGSDASDGPREIAPDADVAMNPPKWVFELVGVFPYRDQPAPIPVYVIYLLVVASLLWLGVRRARGAQRVAVLAALVLSQLVPVVLTLLTAEQRGAIWQGRYGLAFVVGIPLMCGLVLDRAGWAPRERARLIPLGAAMVVACQAWALGNVAQNESTRAVSAADPDWVTAHPVVLAALMAVGSTLIALESVRTARRVPASVDASHSEHRVSARE
jgi:hypothetical protein